MPSAEKCKALPNMEAADCLSTVVSALEPILDRYYQAARVSIQKSALAEQGIIADELNEANGNLEQAQASWKAYRDAHCDMVGKLYRTAQVKPSVKPCVSSNIQDSVFRAFGEFGGSRGLPEPY